MADWIGKMFAKAKSKGTLGRCSGKKYGSSSCPPGSKQYDAAKTLSKLRKRIKK